MLGGVLGVVLGVLLGVVLGVGVRGSVMCSVRARLCRYESTALGVRCSIRCSVRGRLWVRICEGLSLTLGFDYAAMNQQCRVQC